MTILEKVKAEIASKMNYPCLGKFVGDINIEKINEYCDEVAKQIAWETWKMAKISTLSRDSYHEETQQWIFNLWYNKEQKEVLNEIKNNSN